MPKSQPPITDFLSNLEAKIEKTVLSKSIPGLPESVKEIIVKLTPWLVLLSLILFFPVILAAFGLSALVLPFSFMGGIRVGFGYTLTLVFTFGMVILELMALPGLFKRQQKAWRLVFYSVLLSLTQQLLNLDLLGLLVGGAVSFYFLFQVKSKYKK